MKILFVCEGNMTRSQMAETFYNTFTKSHDATSAGAIATLKNHASERGETVMKEIGLTMAGQKSDQLTQEMVDAADKVVWFPTPYMPSYVTKSYKAELWDVADPHYEENRTIEIDRAVRDEIKKRIEKLIDEN